MSKYGIAWLPGDGIGNDVMEAARIVLDSVELDADYVHDHRDCEDRSRRRQARAGVRAVGLRLRLRGPGAERARGLDRQNVAKLLE